MIIFLSPMMFLFWTVFQMVLLMLTWTLGLYLKFPRTMLLLTAIGLIVGALYSRAHSQAISANTYTTSTQIVRSNLPTMPRIYPATLHVSPVFDYPSSLQKIDFNGSWDIRIDPIPGAINYHWYLLQDGHLLEDTLTPDVAVDFPPADKAHQAAHTGFVELVVFAETGPRQRSEGAQLTFDVE